MHIGILDLIVIYSIPFIIIGIFLFIFLAVLYIVVKKDIGHLDVSEDIRYNIEIRKRPIKFSVLAQVILFENGVQAAVLYRFSRYLYLHGLRPLGAVLHKFSKFLTSHDVPPTAKVGPGVVFLHIGAVLTPFCEVGSHVHFRPYSGMRGWGTVKLEDEVHIGFLSAVVDGTVMGKNSESAPGSIVTKDVPPDHIAFGVPATNMVPKPETKLRGVVLELENVLLEPTDILTDALDAALQQAGVRLSKSKRSKIEGLPPEKVINNQLRKNKALREETLQEYLGRARSSVGNGLRLRSSGKELIEKLRERDLKVAVVSRQPDALTKEIVEGLGLMQSLDFVCGADDVLAEWKPQPWIVFRPMLELKIGAERVIYVGGTRLDMRTGMEAAIHVYLIAPADVAQVPKRALVTLFPDLESVLAEFSKPELPKTF
jgi:serine O-acetyltransferase